ncbi:50S ribosomal subunit protein L6 [mine drainage metagenome]|uniref:50S ribosomal subunit protein L6 n=1 Tax=mine drainage metagenome TaxID=410659 RepID=T1AP59_9ZZZZ
MSRIAKAPVPLPQGVTATIADGTVTVKGNKGTLSLSLNAGVSVVQADKQLEVKYSRPERSAHAGRLDSGAPREHGARCQQGL